MRAIISFKKKTTIIVRNENLKKIKKLCLTN